MTHLPHPCALVICDGLGIRPDAPDNAVTRARAPHLHAWMQSAPHAILAASGVHVGLLPSMTGNSLVGHITIGSGRIVDQPISIFHRLIQEKSLCALPALHKNLAAITRASGRVHLMGLLSDGGSHSHEELAHALIACCAQAQVPEVYVHAFLDGRDAPPRSAATFLSRLTQHCADRCTLASISGRAYPMDRAEHNDMLMHAVDMLTGKQQASHNSWQQVLDDCYARDVTDEFIPPTLLDARGVIRPGDGIIFWNIRADRARELTRALTTPPAPKLAWFISAVPYHATLATEPLIALPVAHNTFLDALTKAHQTVTLCAESEKFAHVTYFFNGGRELTNASHEMIVIPSFSADDILRHPEMKAPALTDMVMCSLRSAPSDWYIINYANADMLGHTGNYNLAVRAIAALDEQLQRLYDEFVTKRNGSLIITADHGNAEQIWDADAQQPHTRHTINPVPFIMLTHNGDLPQTLPLHELADIAPYLLRLSDIPVPAEMRRKCRE